MRNEPCCCSLSGVLLLWRIREKKMENQYRLERDGKTSLETTSDFDRARERAVEQSNARTPDGRPVGMVYVDMLTPSGRSVNMGAYYLGRRVKN